MLLAPSIYRLGHQMHSLVFSIFPRLQQLPLRSPAKSQNPQITILVVKTSLQLTNSILDIYSSAGITFRMYCPKYSPYAEGHPTRLPTMKEKSIQAFQSRAGAPPLGKETRRNSWPLLTCGFPTYPAPLGIPIWCVRYHFSPATKIYANL